MLQQTQVSTVVPYFDRFVRRFPTLKSLAAARLDDVLRLWQGLGYYRRAVNLHRAAIEIIEQCDGRVPNDAARLRRLPGVGRYIAGAVLSIAFDMRSPILEANTARVLARLFLVNGPLRASVTQQRLWSLSQALLPQRDAGLHNQAMMELGALVCISGQPRCEQCPVETLCEARAAGIESRLPELGRQREFVDVSDAAVIVRRNGRVLIVRRPIEGRWGGLWELPRTTVAAGADPRDAVAAHVRDRLGLEIEVGRELLTVKHGVTHHRITLSCFECVRVRGRVRLDGYAESRWETPRRLGRFAFSSPQRKLIAAIRRGLSVEG